MEIHWKYHNMTTSINQQKLQRSEKLHDSALVAKQSHYCDQPRRRVATYLHCYCRIGKKNPSGWIKGSTLCKLPWPEALALHTPWHPLSFTSCLHASSTAKAVKNWTSESAALLAEWKKKRKGMLLVVEAAVPCVRMTASVSADQHTWPVAVELLQRADFYFFPFSF